MNISGAKFEEHRPDISRDILNSVLNKMNTGAYPGFRFLDGMLVHRRGLHGI